MVENVPDFIKVNKGTRGDMEGDEKVAERLPEIRHKMIIPDYWPK